MAPPKSNKPPEINPWGWVSQVQPEDVCSGHLLAAYRITGFQPCVEARRNCKRNPYCYFGLGEKKWKDDSDGDDDQDGAAFRCEGEYAGLQNLGATCYVNSLLQLWFHNPIFRPAILKWTPTGGTPSEDYKPNCPLAQLQAIFARLKISKRSKIDPSDFVSSLLLNTGEQQDAQEFAKLFMEYIVKLLTEYGDEQIRRLIAQSFNGQLQYETECIGCKNRSRRSEGFTELNLSVKKNLGESLDELLADETISEYMCSNCHKKSTVKRRMQLCTLPPILNLQLLRFVYDREAQRRKKVVQNISFPEVLEMQDRVYEVQENESYKYHLTAVLVHNGQSASSGHYIAQIKDLRTGEWLKFNDEFVDTVAKNRSQKAKEKEDEKENDDSEKKPKSKRSKNSPSLTSPGAYMLVYTLDQYIQRPEPDPELHQYLVDLVKREDATFEKEINKNKSEKDFEQAVRNQRRKEVDWLYEIMKQEAPENGKEDESNDEPRQKIPRYDDEAPNESHPIESSAEMNVDEAPNSKSNGHSDDSSHRPSNGVGTEVSFLPIRKKYYELDECDFISVDWISQWLDPGNPVPPVENAMLLCEHKKLAPPSPTSTACLYRIIPSPLAGAWYDNYQGGPRLKGQDLCEICVKNYCRKLRGVAELEDDNKKVTDLVKKLDSDTSGFVKSGNEIPNSMLENKVWIHKDSFKNWKKVAKLKIEGSEINNEQKDNSDEQMGDSEDGILNENRPFNADLFCEHGNLSPDANSRKMIPQEAWTMIQKYFKDAITLDVIGSTSCDDCRNQEQSSAEALQQMKQVAQTQKSGLSDLYLNRNRPNPNHVGTHYVVSSSFVAEWKRFIKEPSRYDAIREIDNQTLICEHDKFMYPPTFISEFMENWDENDEIIMTTRVCVVTPEEWDFIQANFECDREIKIEKTSRKEASITYEPEMCQECAIAWLEETYKKHFEYEEAPIYVVKREKGDTVESEDEDSQKDQVVVTGKREVKRVDPDAWMHGFTSTNTNANNNSSARRSSRPRNSKGEKTYKLSSTVTIKELKSKICVDFKAMLSDQHLFHRRKELTDLSKSLSDYFIPPRAKLYLEIDTAENGSGDVEEPPARGVELGFRGTLLIGGNNGGNGGNALGDNRSPVQD